jgi:signal transduction histidine kinase
MAAETRGRSLSRQLVAPVVGLVLAAVLVNAAVSAWLAARRGVAAARAGQEQLATALRDARVALSPQVLETLHALTGSHFVVWNAAPAAPGASTLPAGAVSDDELARAAADIGGIVTIAGRRHRVGTAQAAGVRPETVLVLTPLASPLRTLVDALWPVLAVAAGTLAVLVPLSLRTTGRLAERIAALERHVGRIAGGEFGHTLPRPRTPDAAEVGRLVAGVDRMSTTLATLRAELVAGERQRLLGQLAAGFAHELRNAVTGAQLAIDLHRRRCGAATADDSLVVASRQLDILEEEVRGLLALGRQPQAAPEPLAVDPLVAEVRDLTAARCQHAGVRVEVGPATGLSMRGRRDALRAALVNLALNAVDATGRDGTLRLSARAAEGRLVLAVEDDGPGPPEAIRDTLHEPFVTGKPEGIGLGLAVAKAVAEAHGGSLSWDRTGGWTRFAITLPLESAVPAPAPAHA